MLAALVVTLALAGDDPGFGGGGETTTATASDDDVCVIKGDDGAWHSCDDVIAAKKKASDDEKPVADDAQTAALRKQMRDVEARHAQETAPLAEPPKKTKLEEEYAKAKLDASLPLLALRIEAERAQDAVKALEDKGVGGDRKDEAQAKMDESKAILDEIETIAIHRMDVCSQRKGNKPLIKNYKMTAGGPIMMTSQEALNALPRVDPVGCERINLVDDKLVARVKRKHELTKILAAKDFGWDGVDQRRVLEKELAAVEQELKNDQIPVLAAPGAKDPPGLRMLTPSKSK
jgi:hypothetical protein